MTPETAIEMLKDLELGGRHAQMQTHVDADEILLSVLDASDETRAVAEAYRALRENVGFYYD